MDNPFPNHANYLALVLGDKYVGKSSFIKVLTDSRKRASSYNSYRKYKLRPRKNSCAA